MPLASLKHGSDAVDLRDKLDFVRLENSIPKDCCALSGLREILTWLWSID